MGVVDRSFDSPLKVEEDSVEPLAGGIARHGYQCGMLWGAALAAGARAYRLCGPGPQAEAGAIAAAQRLVDVFRARTSHIDCFDITGLDLRQRSKRRAAGQALSFLFIKGGLAKCFRLAAGYAKEARREIDAALSGGAIEAPSPPVSCAAMVAEKMGESEMHTVMAAGFAGGIGLSGGGCGALGAAIWIVHMDGRREQVRGKVINSRIDDTIDKFLRSTDSRFLCSEIVGRRFENVADHAAYLRDGGCSKIIEGLAAG